MDSTLLNGDRKKLHWLIELDLWEGVIHFIPGNVCLEVPECGFYSGKAKCQVLSMNRFLMKFWALSILLTLASSCFCFGFLPYSDLLTVSPAVAKAGSTVEVTVSGKDLDELKLLRFSDSSIKAIPLMTPADEFHPQPRPVEGKFTVTIPDSVKPGVYEVRSLGYFGLSTARPFLVVAADADETALTGDRSSREVAHELPVGSGAVAMLANGKFDWFSFTGKKGERVVAQVWAERLDSKADVLLTIVSDDGRELESSRHHAGRDPLVDFTPEEDGTYYVRLTDALYKGGKEYFYRLRLSRDPFIDFVFPPAGEPGTSPRFTFFGRNLPGGSLGENWILNGKPLETLEKAVAVPEAKAIPAVFDPGAPRQGLLPGFYTGIANSNQVKIGFASAPVIQEEIESDVQNVKPPVEIAGRFNEPGDYDVFRFSGKKDTIYWIEVISQRLGTLTDPYLLIEKIAIDKEGAETFTKWLENDDPPSFYGRDYLDDLNADTLDPTISFTPEEDGEFRITLVNQSAGGSAAHLYRLAIREAKPDFQMMVSTELTKTINNDAWPVPPIARRGGSVVYRVFAFREDGFDGDIEVSIKGLPEGVSAKPLILSGATQEGFLTVQASAGAKEWHGAVTISGAAQIGGKALSRVAHPASILWGKRVFANSSQVRSRLDLETVLSVIGNEIEPTQLLPREDKVWTVAMGETLELPIKTIETGRRTGNLQVNVQGFPGLHRSPPTAAIAETAKEGVLSIPMKKSANFEIAPGRFQFVLQGVGNAKYERNPEAMKRTSAEVTRLKALAVSIDGASEKATEGIAAAEKSPEAPEKAATVAEAKKMLAAEKARAVVVKRELALAEKAAKAAATVAAEKTSQFATYSMPITVVVTEEEKK
ncbi:PPC domain-containing protein [Verrucomicrobiales bacterium]|nr:PPC domain-containing protein [Verrucomicrobiales bacterium]